MEITLKTKTSFLKSVIKKSGIWYLIVILGIVVLLIPGPYDVAHVLPVGLSMAMGAVMGTILLVSLLKKWNFGLRLNQVSFRELRKGSKDIHWQDLWIVRFRDDQWVYVCLKKTFESYLIKLDHYAPGDRQYIMNLFLEAKQYHGFDMYLGDDLVA